MPFEVSAVVTVTGSFDAAAAARLCELAERLCDDGGAASVVVEFGDPQELTYVGLAALVEGQAQGRLPLRLRGLADHHQRILRYLGYRIDGSDALSGDAEAEGAPPPGPGARPSGTTGESVLVIEEDAELRSAVAEALASEGYDLLEADSGDEALRLLRRESARPDLILLDLGIPPADRREFRRAHLADPELSSIPVVVIAGGQDDGTSAGVVPGPIGRKQLVETVARVLALRSHLLERGPPPLAAALAAPMPVPGQSTRCAWCDRSRSGSGAWQEAEGAPPARTDAPASHGICPDCARRYFGAR